ncbi:MAG TPA: hypothetical protein VGI54_10175, partial [Solirubrobacteraceae bacterium]
MLIALVAIVALGLAAVAAQAAKVTGGTSSITASKAAAKVLADNHITVKALKPATSSGATFTFPIARGRINVKNLRGTVYHRGGISLSNGRHTVVVRRPVVVSTKKGAWIVAGARVPGKCKARKHHKVRCWVLHRFHKVRILRLTGAKVSGSSATATAKITPATAQIVNALAGKKVVKAG